MALAKWSLVTAVGIYEGNSSQAPSQELSFHELYCGWDHFTDERVEAQRGQRSHSKHRAGAQIKPGQPQAIYTQHLALPPSLLCPSSLPPSVPHSEKSIKWTWARGESVGAP